MLSYRYMLYIIASCYYCYSGNNFILFNNLILFHNLAFKIKKNTITCYLVLRKKKDIDIVDTQM
jgi:hypothetical protein